MSAFPQLRTGAVAQYPAVRTIAKSTWVARFVDGAEQRYRMTAAPRRKWVISLARLTEAETVAVREFVDANAGAFGSFAFTDPWDGSVHANCSLEGDRNAIEWSGENNAATHLTIHENRS